MRSNRLFKIAAFVVAGALTIGGFNGIEKKSASVNTVSVVAEAAETTPTPTATASASASTTPSANPESTVSPQPTQTATTVPTTTAPAQTVSPAPTSSTQPVSLAALSADEVINRMKTSMSQVKVLGISVDMSSMLGSTSENALAKALLSSASMEIEYDMNNKILYLNMANIMSEWVDYNGKKVYQYSSLDNSYEFTPLSNKDLKNLDSSVASTEESQKSTLTTNVTYNVLTPERVTFKNQSHDCYVIKTSEIDQSQTGTDTLNSLISSSSVSAESSNKMVYTYYIDGTDFRVYAIDSENKSAGANTTTAKQRYNIYYPESVTVPAKVKLNARLSDSYSFKKRGVTYSVKTKGNSTYLEATYAKKTPKRVVIPAAFRIAGKAYQVKSVSNNAFRYNVRVRKLVIGKNVTNVGRNTFYKCTKLKNITVRSRRLNRASKKYLRKLRKKKVKVRGRV